MAKKQDKQQFVIQQITVKAPQRKTYDIGDWRTALRSADMGRVKLLYDLFDDIMLDGILCDAVQKRIDAVTNSELAFFDANGQEVPEMTAIIDTLAWEALLSEIMRKKIYGRAAVEIKFIDDVLHVFPIPAKHINLDSQNIVFNDTDETGYPYEGDDTILVLGDKRDFGLLLKAAQYVIYKRGGFGDWAQWVELFGMPQRIGKYNTHDPESRRLLEEAFEHAGSAPYVVVPKEAEIETTAGGSSSGASYGEFRQACNEEMLITMLGQTLTTIQGEKGARSLGEVHKDVEEGKNRSDLRYVQRVLNQYVLPMLEARGLPVAGGSFVFPKAAESLSVAEVVQLSDIMDIPQSYLHEKYSIPVPENGEPIARRQSMPAFMPGDVEPVENRDRSFWMRLRDFFAKAPAMTGASAGNPLITLSDDASFDDRLIARVANGEAKHFDVELFRFFAEEFLRAIKSPLKGQLNNIDVAYDHDDDAFITALEQNIFHFSAGKTFAECIELNRLARECDTFADFKKKAGEVVKEFNERWFKTEYDTAILAAESAVNYRRLMSQKHIYPYWMYVTVDDEAVRDEHRMLHSIVLNAEDKHWDKIYPPNGWNCRCRVRGVMKYQVDKDLLAKSSDIVTDYMDTGDWHKAIKSGWDTNRAKRSEIFSVNQMYIKRFPEVAGEMLKEVPTEKWGVNGDFNELIDDKRPAIREYTGEANDFWKDKATVINDNEYLIITDYAGRKWRMNKEDYDAHTTNFKKSRAFRKKYLNCIDEVVSDPDEVWLSHEFKDEGNPKSKLNNWLMIKYYNETAIVCVCKLEKGVLAFKSWYELKNPKVRSGILIRKK